MNAPGDGHSASRLEQFVSLHLLRPVIEGGTAGRRQLMLLLYAVFLPVSTVEVVLVGHLNPLLLAFRALLGVVILGWLVWRRSMSDVEWLCVAVIIPAIGNLGSQLAVGAEFNALLAVNAVVVLAVMSLVFDAWLLIAGIACVCVGNAAVQYHFHGAGVALAAGMVFALGATVVTAVVHVTAQSLRRSYAELQTSHSRSQQLHGLMASAADDERRRIGGELHDDTIQVMTAAAMQVDVAQALIRDGDTDRAEPAVRHAGDSIRAAIERTRRLSFGLYPPVLDQLGLRPALEVLGQQVAADGQFAVTVSAPDGRVPVRVERLAYRTIRELLTNAERHAAPSQVRVEIVRCEGSLECVVRDDGRGFDDTDRQRARRTHHVGLDSAAERVRLAGGTFSIDSDAGAGTSVQFTIPSA